jgi:glutamate racemase
MKIGVLDSGIGGLTILKRLINKYHNHEYIYFGDTLNMPYGEKNKEELIECGNKIIKFLESMDVDIIILACGTLSNNIKYLKSKKKIISLLPLLDNKLDKYKEVSIMATPLSIKTNIYKKYIHTKLNLIPCYSLADAIEHNSKDIDKLLKKYVKEVKGDVLLLGCTHYPIVKNNIKKYYKGDIIGLEDFISDGIKDIEESEFKLKLYFSKIDDNLINNVKSILLTNNLNIESRIL